MYRDNYDKPKFIEIFDSLAQDYILTNMDNPNYGKMFEALLGDEGTYADEYGQDLRETQAESWEDAVMASTEPEERPAQERPLRPRQAQAETLRQQQPRPQPMPRPPRPQPMPQPPRQSRPSFPPSVRPPSGARAVRLSADIYRQIRSLENTYEQLIRIAPRNQAEQLQRMQREMRLLAIPALNIYITLSGNVTLSFSRSVYDNLPNNYCNALRITFNRVNNLYDDVLTLQRLVNITSIDRQLIIMAAVLQRQLTTMNRMLIDCYTR